MPEPSGHRPLVGTFYWGGVMAVGIGLPLLTRLSLSLLDWAMGPDTPLVPLGALGLSGGLVAGLPFSLLEDWLVRTLGGPGTWLPLVAIFPFAAWGVSRLVGGSRWCRLGAATLYCVNPFVFQRIYVGHFGLLLGYALLPFAVTSALHFVRSGDWWMPIPALWWAVLTALSPHFAWIYGLVLLAVWLTHHPVRWSSINRVIAMAVAFAALSMYILLPYTGTQPSSTHGTSGLLDLYRTTGDPHLGLFPNVLGLYGFWRLGPGPTLPKSVVTGWPFLLLAILFVAGVGAFVRLRSARGSVAQANEDTTGRRTAGALLIIGIAGYFLALGNQGPTGPLFRWAYFHVPFFAVMEEPQKFLMLTALAYAVFFGWGVERLVGSANYLRFNRRTLGAFAVAILLPLAYTPTIFDGLAGQITPSHLPTSWQTADELMGDGPGQILFLPWHLYLSFPFTDGRVIANPAPTSFRRSVISGDNVEASAIESTSTSPRSAYLARLFATGPETSNFGAKVAPLGVEYVVLAKTVDWRNYSWLTAQPNLRLVMNSASLEVWRNMSYAGVGQSGANRQIRQISPVAYEVGAGTPGWVSLDAPYQKGWELQGHLARQSPEGTLLFYVDRSGGVAQFTPWGLTRLGYIISGGSFLLLSVLVVADRLRRRVRRP